VIRYVRRPGLGAFTTALDPTAGKLGGGPIIGPSSLSPCSVRYLADGTAQMSGTPRAGGICWMAGTWTNIDMSNPFDGLKRWIDGIEEVWSSVARSSGFASGVSQIGWNVTTDGQATFDARAAAMRAAGSSDSTALYAPLPSGVDQTTPVTSLTSVNDPVMMQYAIAKAAANQHGPAATSRIWDPFTWKGYQALPDGFLEPVDGGVWVLASDNVLDAVQKMFGIMADPWYWLVATHPTTGQERLFLVNRGPNVTNIFTRLGKTGPMVISILGTVLGPFTLGVSTAVASVVDTAIAIGQKKTAAAAAAASNQHQADVLNQQVADQTVQVNQQADSVYTANQTAFLAAGYTPDKWAALTLDQKTALLQQAAAGQLQPTPAAVAVAQQTQQAVDQAVASATVNAALSTTPAPASSGWLLALLGVGGAVALAAGGKKR
jgi:hypothetical protein